MRSHRPTSTISKFVSPASFKDLRSQIEERGITNLTDQHVKRVSGRVKSRFGKMMSTTKKVERAIHGAVQKTAAISHKATSIANRFIKPIFGVIPHPMSQAFANGIDDLAKVDKHIQDVKKSYSKGEEIYKGISQKVTGDLVGTVRQLPKLDLIRNAPPADPN